jgi:hypothetical protein
MFNELANGLASMVSKVPLPGKLTLIPLATTNPIKLGGVPYVCMFNPESYAENFTVAYDGCSEPGSGGDKQQFVRTKSPSFSFEILIDGTGGSGAKREVEVDTLLLKEFTRIRSDTHAPPFVLAVWGTFYSICVMTSLTITYTMFRANGTPLRAKATFTLSGHVDKLLDLLRRNLQSPDLTHFYRTVAGDTLTSVSQQIYDDPRFYPQIADVNGLTSLRGLSSNRELRLPPIKNTTNA